MKKSIRTIKAKTLLICFAVIPGDGAFAQKTQSSSGNKRQLFASKHVVFEFEQMSKHATNECAKLWLMTYIAPAAFADGDLLKAKTHEQTIVTQTETRGLQRECRP